MLEFSSLVAFELKIDMSCVDRLCWDIAEGGHAIEIVALYFLRFPVYLHFNVLVQSVVNSKLDRSVIRI